MAKSPARPLATPDTPTADDRVAERQKAEDDKRAPGAGGMFRGNGAMRLPDGGPRFMVTNIAHALVRIAFGDETVIADEDSFPLLPGSQMLLTAGSAEFVALFGPHGAVAIHAWI